MTRRRCRPEVRSLLLDSGAVVRRWRAALAQEQVDPGDASCRAVWAAYVALQDFYAVWSIVMRERTVRWTKGGHAVVDGVYYYLPKKVQT